MLDQKRIEKFRRVVEQSTGNFAGLATQVDPDALGSGAGIVEILERLTENEESRKVNMAYCGSVSDPQNQAIMRELGLIDAMTRVGSYDFAPDENIVLVDSSRINDSRVPDDLLPLEPLIVVDHHRSNLPDEAENQFFWIDEQIGSASAMVVEIYRALGLEPSTTTATALALGIHNDTNSLASATDRDRQAFGFVADLAKESDLRKLIDFMLPPAFFDILRRVLENIELHDGRLLASAGWIDKSESDFLARIADLLGRRSDASLIFVWGIVQNTRTALIKARSSDMNIDLHNLLVETFGRDVAGAKETSGGTGIGGADLSVDLGRWSHPGAKDEQESLVRKHMRIWTFGEKYVNENSSE